MKKFKAASVLGVAAFAMLGQTATTATETVSIRVSPTVAMAPATVRVFVTVEPDAENRELELVADSGVFYTSSTVQLEGNKAPRFQSFVLKELPAGTYEVSARVRQRNGERHLATAEYLITE